MEAMTSVVGSDGQARTDCSMGLGRPSSHGPPQSNSSAHHISTKSLSKKSTVCSSGTEASSDW